MAPERVAQRVNPDGETLLQAAESGNLAVVQWLMAPERGAQRVNPDIYTLREAALSGNLAFVQWLIAPERGAQRVNPNIYTLHGAALSGNLALVQWLMAPERAEQRLNPDERTLHFAAESGNLAVVQWLMAPERGAQRVEPSPALVAEVRGKGINRAINLWFEQALQLKKTPTAAPLSTHGISQQPQRAESKTSTQSANSADNKGTLVPNRLESKANASHQVSSQSSTAGKGLVSTGFSSTSTTTSSSSITTNTQHQAGEQKETKQTQRGSSRKEDAPSLAATTDSADGLAPFQKASDVTEYLRLHDELDKAARAGNLALVQQLMMAPARGAQRVSPSVETLSYAAQSGNLALVQWLMAPARGAQRVAPDADTLRSAVMSKNLALVQWLMAPERGEERVDPSPELISEVKERKLGNPAIKQWFEELFPPQKTPVASSALTQNTKNRTQQPLNFESKPFYPAGLPESKDKSKALSQPSLSSPPVSGQPKFSGNQQQSAGKTTSVDDKDKKHAPAQQPTNYGSAGAHQPPTQVPASLSSSRSTPASPVDNSPPKANGGGMSPSTTPSSRNFFTEAAAATIDQAVKNATALFAEGKDARGEYSSVEAWLQTLPEEERALNRKALRLMAASKNKRTKPEQLLALATAFSEAYKPKQESKEASKGDAPAPKSS